MQNICHIEEFFIKTIMACSIKISYILIFCHFDVLFDMFDRNGLTNSGLSEYETLISKFR